jgi:hypothetical protein
MTNKDALVNCWSAAVPSLSDGRAAHAACSAQRQARWREGAAQAGSVALHYN